MISQTFGHLTVVSAAGRNEYGTRMFLCRCDCGGTTTVRGSDLKSGRHLSCACGQGRDARTAARRPWTEAELSLLGTDTDHAVALRIGRSRAAVSNKRRRLGIPDWHGHQQQQCPECGADYRGGKVRCGECLRQRERVRRRRRTVQQNILEAQKHLEDQ